MAPAEKRYFYEEQRQEYLMEQTRLERERKNREQHRMEVVQDVPFRLPKAALRVLQPLYTQGQTITPPTQTTQVNKLALAGIGRGQPKRQFQEMSNGFGISNSEQVLKSLAMGRGVGRGTFSASNGQPVLPVAY